MPEFNELLNDKLKEYSKDIQNLANFAITHAKKMSGSSLSQLLESEVKKIVRKGAKK